MNDEINSINDEKGKDLSEEEIDKMQERQKKILFDGIKTLIGTEILKLSFGALIAMYSLSAYLLSYLRHFQKEKTLTLQHGYFFSLILLLTMSIFNIFAPAVEKKVGLKFVILIGSSVDILCCLIFNFSKSYFLDLFAIFLNAFANSPLVLIGRNLMGYFFDIRGRLNGGLSLIDALVRAGYNILAEKVIVNPLSDEADEDDSFYTFDISKNILNFYKLTIIFIIISTAISLIFIVPFDPKIHENGIFNKENILIKKKKNEKDKDDIKDDFKDNDNNDSLLPTEGNEINNYENENKIINNSDEKGEENKEKKKKKKLTITIIKKSLKSRRILKLFLMGVTSAPLMNFLMNMWRPIAIRVGIPTIYQQNLNTYNPFVSCASTLIFSWLSDTVPFRFLYSSLSFINTFVSIFFCFTFDSPLLFTLILLLHSIASSGRMAITGPHYMKVFGLKYFIQIGGVIGFSRVLMTPICYVFMFVFDGIFAKVSTQSISTIPYYILFITCGAINSIGAILSLYETEEKLELEL